VADQDEAQVLTDRPPSARVVKSRAHS
jgi:hypothetical protein